MTLDQALTLAFQFVNQPMADLAIKEMADDLAGYPLPNVLHALKRCRSELKAIRFSDILDRIPGGHPGLEEAWATVSQCLANEDRSVVWTDEMREAYGVAALLATDPIAARMAFKEKYTALVSQARATKQPVRWSVSLGFDPAGRAAALQLAVHKNQISAGHAAALLNDDGSLLPAIEALTTDIGRSMPAPQPEVQP
jgi:hypothetical protein